MLTDFDEGSGDEGEAMTAAEVLQKLEEVRFTANHLVVHESRSNTPRSGAKSLVPRGTRNSAPLLFGFADALETRPQSSINNWRPVAAHNMPLIYFFGGSLESP